MPAAEWLFSGYLEAEDLEKTLDFHFARTYRA
jgi:hypothetical protein